MGISSASFLGATLPWIAVSVSPPRPRAEERATVSSNLDEPRLARSLIACQVGSISNQRTAKLGSSRTVVLFWNSSPMVSTSMGKVLRDWSRLSKVR